MTSAIVFVMAQKIGRLFFHPIGNTNGKAINGSSPGLVGKMSASFGMSSGIRSTP